MTTETANQATCAACSKVFPLDDLVSLGGYPVCRSCLAKAPLDGRMEQPRRYRKIVEGRQLAGVCGGLADAMNMDRDTLRVITAISVFLSGGAVLIGYFALALILPTAID